MPPDSLVGSVDFSGTSASEGSETAVASDKGSESAGPSDDGSEVTEASVDGSDVTEASVDGSETAKVSVDGLEKMSDCCKLSPSIKAFFPLHAARENIRVIDNKSKNNFFILTIPFFFIKQRGYWRRASKPSQPVLNALYHIKSELLILA